MIRPRLAWAFLILALCCIPPALIIDYISRDGVNVPFWEEWEGLYPVAVHTVEGNLTLADLFAPQSQHRVVFTKIVTAVNTLLTGWDVRYEMLFSVVIAAGIWVVMLLLYRRDYRAPASVFALGFSVLMFAYRHKQNWLMGLQTSFFFSQLFVGLALLVLRSSPVGWRALVIAAAFATCASFSALSGVVAWVATPVALFLLGYRRPRHYVVWGALAAVILLAFLTNYSVGRSVEQGVFTVENVARFSFAMLGSPFVPELDVWVDSAVQLGIGGFVLALTLLAFLWRSHRDPHRLAVWVSFCAFVGGSILVTAVGRIVSFQPLSGRYSTLIVFFWGTVLALGIETIWTMSRKRLRPLSAAFAAVISIAFAVYGYQYVVTNQWVQQYPWQINQSDLACLPNFIATGKNDCFSRLFWDPAAIDMDERVRTLWRYELSTFAHANGIALTQFPFTPLTPQLDTRITTFAPNGQPSIPAIFQHPPSQIAFTLTIPASAVSAVFTTSVVVDGSNVESSPDISQDGVLFRVTVQDADPATSDLTTQQAVDPTAMDAPVLLQLELGTFAGQTITLILETDPRANSSFDWAFWLSPRVIWSPS